MTASAACSTLSRDGNAGGKPVHGAQLKAKAEEETVVGHEEIYAACTAFLNSFAASAGVVIAVILPNTHGAADIRTSLNAAG
jgi:hypothetical protein